MEVEEELETDESAVWALWGRYEKATLGAVQQGMYEVHFASGGSRWTTVMELALPEHKTSAPLAVGATALLPDGEGYVMVTVQSVGTDQIVVRREDAQGKELKVAVHELCVPLASGPMLGACPKLLEKGAAVYALRGHWLPAQVVESVPGLHRLVLQFGLRAADVWVGGGQLASRLEPDDPAVLVAGAHVLVEDGEGAAVEGQLLEPDDGAGSALVQLMGGGEGGGEGGSGAPALVPIDRLRLRYDPCFRVLAPTGGLIPGEVVEQGPDGLLLVKLERGGQRWASSAEIFAQAPPSPEQLAGLTPHSLVAALPEPLSAEAAAPRWIAAGVVAAAAAAAAGDAGAPLALRRPSNQRRCSVTMVRKDGRFGLDLDDQNRVVSVQPGGGSDGLGIQVGDEVVECDGLPVVHNGLGAAVKGKERALLGLRTAGDDSEAGAAAGGGDGGSWAVEPARVRLPLLSKATCAAVSVVVGSRVFVLDGPWAEAVVEEQEDGFYLLHYGGGQRRWASSGEIAWHDIAPMPYDVAAGKQARTPRTHTDWAHTAHRAPRTAHRAPRTRRRAHGSAGRARPPAAGARVAGGARLHGAGVGGAREGRQPAGRELRRRGGLGEAARHDALPLARAVARTPARARPVGQLPQGDCAREHGGVAAGRLWGRHRPLGARGGDLTRVGAHGRRAGAGPACGGGHGGRRRGVRARHAARRGRGARGRVRGDARGRPRRGGRACRAARAARRGARRGRGRGGARRGRAGVRRVRRLDARLRQRHRRRRWGGPRPGRAHGGGAAMVDHARSARAGAQTPDSPAHAPPTTHHPPRTTHHSPLTDGLLS